MKNWKITYSKKEILGSIVKEYSSEPSEDQAALLIRDDVLSAGFLLVDQFRNETDKNVALLKHNDVLIVCIEEIIEYHKYG
ncbi:MAG: hypothetical protein Q8Q81_09435 [Oxalobacteraceae bacterium]|nr:hypothetical protein [Oxalobacteraceae bacterium]